MPADITPQAPAPVRTCQRGYARNGYRAGQVQRVHVVRERGPKGQHGTSTLCGQFTGAHRQSEGIFREAPHDLPEGLSWCPTCVGKLAEQTGRTAEIAGLLGLAPREVPLRPDGTCGGCEEGLIWVSRCTCGGGGPDGCPPHEPMCGAEPCPNGCWDRLHPSASLEVPR